MPGTTTPDGIVHPVVGDKMNPLATWFTGLATSTQAAISALRGEFTEPEYPSPSSVTGPGIQSIVATAWADVPGMDSITLELEQACWVAITVGALIVAQGGGDTSIGARVTGATTLGETQLEVGGPSGSYGQVIYAQSPLVGASGSSYRIVRLNAGTNTITARAYCSTPGVHMANYVTLQASPIRWA